MKSSPILQKAFAKTVSLVLLLAWCVIAFNCDTVAPRHSWSRKWGPMVPHQNFPGDCGICHVPDGWDVMRTDFEFDHERETGFVLEGAHGRAACLRCHNDRGPVDIYLARGCGGCHVDPHKSSLSMDCERCHDQETWFPSQMIADHARTRFPLAFAHAVAPCEGCHDRASVGDFRGAPVDCHLCHQRDVARAVPNHAASGWVRDCEDCHEQTAWIPAPRFDHNFFPLQGGHAGLACGACHPGGQIGPLNPDCFACHQNDYLGAPNHVANNFSTNCTDCHNIFDWNDA